MRRLLLALLLLLALCAGRAPAETLAERYWRLHRERNPTTRYGAPPTVDTNQVNQAGGGGDGGELGDLVVTCDGFSSNNYGDSFGPLTATLRFTVPFETAQGWSGYVLEGQSEPTDPGDVMSREFIVCDPGTGGNLVMLFHYGTEHLSIQNLYTDNPTVIFFGNTSGTFSISRVAPGPAPVPVPTTVLPAVSRETVRGMLAPPENAPRQSGELWLDCLAIPEGSWLVERPVAGGGTAWCAALCESNALRAVVWRYATGVGPTNLPVTLEHDPTRPIGRVERLYYEEGTGVVARISVSRAGWDWAVSNRCARPSPWIRCLDTNLVVRTDGWVHEHQDYIEERCVPRGEDCYTNVPASTSCLVLYPVFFRGLSLVRQPLLPTYIEYRVPDHLRDVYPIRPPRQWDWRR